MHAIHACMHKTKDYKTNIIKQEIKTKQVLRDKMFFKHQDQSFQLTLPNTVIVLVAVFLSTFDKLFSTDVNKQKTVLK